MYVVTPRCAAAAAAAVVAAVVLRRPTKEYTHRYSMMHRRLTTAGIEVAPHYHRLLVITTIECLRLFFLLKRISVGKIVISEDIRYLATILRSTRYQLSLIHI